MKKLLIAFLAIMTLSFSSLNAAGTAPAVYDIDPYAIYDLNDSWQPFAGEYLNPEQPTITSHDYNAKVQSQIAVWGYPTADNPYPQVKIGNSIGSYVGKQAIVDSNDIIVGWVMGFKHYTVTQGYLVSTYYNGTYDSTAYIK